MTKGKKKGGKKKGERKRRRDAISLPTKLMQLPCKFVMGGWGGGGGS